MREVQVAWVEGDHVEDSYKETKEDSVEKNEESKCSNDEGANHDCYTHENTSNENVQFPSKSISKADTEGCSNIDSEEHEGED